VPQSGRLLALPKTFNRLNMPARTNSLADDEHMYTSAIKRFIILGSGVDHIKLFRGFTHFCKLVF